MSLKSLQQQFISLLLNVKKSGVGMGEVLVPMSRLTIKDSLHIYQNNNRQNLLDALKQIYPLCLDLVGEVFFNAMARNYIQQYPSKEYLLEYYGEHFASFVEKFSPAEGLPYLRDVAKLEWGIHLAMIGEDAKELDFAKLQQTPLEAQSELLWFLLENSSLLEVQYTVHELWHWHQEGRETETFELQKEKVCLFIGRGHRGLMIERLTFLEYEVLIRLQKNLSLSEICEHLLTIDSSANMIEMLPHFIKRGYIDYFGFKQK